MRTYLKTALMKHSDPMVVQAKLVDAWGDPYKLPNGFAWRWYAYSLDGARRQTELRELLLDPKWLQAKLSATDVASLIDDFDYQPEDNQLRLVQQAIRLSSGVLALHPEQFASQIVGRLLRHRDLPEIGLFSSKVAECARSPWLRPTLHPAALSLIRTLEGHSGPVSGVALSSDGTIAVSASDDETLRVWDVKRGLELRTLKGHSGPVRHVVLSRNKQVAVSASDDKTLRVWDVEKGLELHVLEGHTGPVRDVALSNDNKTALSASVDKTLKVWDVEAGLELRTLESHSDAVLTVAMSEECGLAISGSRDKTLKIWDVNNWCLVRTLNTGDSVDSVALTRDGRLAVSCTHSTVWIPGEGPYPIVASIRDVETGRQLHALSGRRGKFTAVTLSTDSKLAFIASEDRRIRIFRVDSGLPVGTLADHASDVNSVALSDDGRIAASASSDRSLKIWDLAVQSRPRELPLHSHIVTSVAISRDGRVAISGSFDGTVMVWQVQGQDEPRTLSHTEVAKAPICGVAFSENGRLALSAGLDSRLRLWNLENGNMRPLISGNVDPFRCIACSDDERTVVMGSMGNGGLAVSASADRTLKLWDIVQSREVRIDACPSRINIYLRP